MLVPNKHGTSRDYRFGFQGQEMDNEIKGEGNSLNYTFRMHDPRIGRFLSIDPLYKSFPWNSPFSFSENRVIDMIELEGGETALSDAFINAAKGGAFGETVQQVVGGIDKSAEKTANGVINLVTNPKQAVKDLGNLSLGIILSSTPSSTTLTDISLMQLDVKFGTSTYASTKAFKQSIAKSGDKLINGNLEDKTEVITDVATLYFSAKGTNLLASEALNISKISLLQKFSIAVPELGTLSNVESRMWYLANEAKIPSFIKGYSSLYKQAKAAFNLRNELRTTTRELMADRKLAAKITIENPNLTWKEVVQKAKDKGLTGDAIYKDIIEGSQKSRASVNESLGVTKPTN